MLLTWLFEDPLYYWTVVITAIVSITIHELAHGVAAIWQGDDTPKKLGHMTWNPVVHMGMVSLAMLAIIGIAWGKMPVSPIRFRGRHGTAWVALAGPLSNMLLAWIGASVLALSGWDRLVDTPGFILFHFSAMNVTLAVLNLLPIPPLDGATILGHIDFSFRRLCSRPDLQPMFLVVFLFVFFGLGRMGFSFFEIGEGAVDAYVDLFS